MQSLCDQRTPDRNGRKVRGVEWVPPHETDDLVRTRNPCELAFPSTPSMTSSTR